MVCGARNYIVHKHSAPLPSYFELTFYFALSSLNLSWYP